MGGPCPRPRPTTLLDELIAYVTWYRPVLILTPPSPGRLSGLARAAPEHEQGPNRARQSDADRVSSACTSDYHANAIARMHIFFVAMGMG